ncbi:MAG: F0F1 ATP synthase subunit gamma [Micavibrio aeruginosavorus]|uniref:ATP synthase gamma chain n=1 Tax=Micavibrio aeruginosavorus TaxID=349221 RepID=A0A7T5R3X1_9BACT|nr:MAG: F0F1 ATP synthase subunit gamma [Micavibrio aeruginosavorus]
MPSLKQYRVRIASVKSTRKITSAMKMVAASKLKKAQEQAEASQPYASAMAGMMARVASGVVIGPNSPKLLIGTGSDQTHLLVVVTSDRGLCGGFNGNLVRRVRQEVRKLQGEGKDVKLLCVGRKGRDVLKREFGSQIVHSFTGLAGRTDLSFAEADEVSQWILEQFDAGSFDVCTLVYNEFVSVLTQKPMFQQLIPFKSSEGNASNDNRHLDQAAEPVNVTGPYSFEPEEDRILGALLPRNLGIQIYRSLLDSGAGEQAARMTAMDNATRNAGDMINKLSIQYNRARQAFITKELIEIISGAEAV